MHMEVPGSEIGCFEPGNPFSRIAFPVGSSHSYRRTTRGRSRKVLVNHALRSGKSRKSLPFPLLPERISFRRIDLAIIPTSPVQRSAASDRGMFFESCHSPWFLKRLFRFLAEAEQERRKQK
jgi:hypothetical protein